MHLPFELPERLRKKLDSAENFTFINNVESFIEPYIDILKANPLFFFSEYTDHGIGHVKSVIMTADNLIPNSITLSSEEVGVLILAIVLHDIGMQTSPDLFKNMINGKYDNIRLSEFDNRTWSDLWEEYVKEKNYWDEEKKHSTFGEKDYEIKTPNLNDLQSLNDYDKKFIAEFIRKHHCRLSHEIAKGGYLGDDPIVFNNKDSFINYLDLAGVIARSHGMDMRDTYDYLENIFGHKKEPLGIHAIYLMSILRLADYLDITKCRTNVNMLKIRRMYSVGSRQEHDIHLANLKLSTDVDDSEKIILHAIPNNAQTHVKIEKLVEDIQKEFDKSWAVLGEVYGNKYTINYRRIITNISNKKYKDSIKDYIPKQFNYQFNNDLSKLLIAPLYGNNPSYGVRELVQNSVDACRAAKNLISKDEEVPHIIVKLDTENCIFTISDTGIGMTLYEIEKYFLTIGSSYNDNIDWKKITKNSNIYRTGRFGIGVLAAYLLGEKIRVITKSRREKSEFGYCFSASLQDKFIEIKKDYNAKFGTTIIIKSNKESVKVLMNQVEYMNIIGYEEWFGWYIDEEPKIEYFCDKRHLLLKKIRVGLYKELKHNSKDFGSIKWWLRTIFFNKNTPYLYCNGIYITPNSSKKYFSEGLNKYYPFNIPSLQITDLNNKLPLNLQRNDIDENVVYDFEKNLAMEACKNLICQLMAIDFPFISRIYNGFLKYFYFNSEGFTIRNEYTNGRLKNKKLINIIINNREILEKIDWQKMFTIVPSCYYCINFSSVSSDYYTMISSKKSFAINEELVFKEKEIIESDYLYRGFRLFNSKNNQSIYKTIIDYFIRNGKFFCQIVIEDIKPQIAISQLDKIFKDYMGENPIIPFDINMRKRKFPKIHNEFSEEIDMYKRIFTNRFGE